MCSLTHAIGQAGLPWPGLPPYTLFSNAAVEGLMGIIPFTHGVKWYVWTLLQPWGERLLSLAVLCTHRTAELLLNCIMRSPTVHSLQKFGCTEYKLYNHTG